MRKLYLILIVGLISTTSWAQYERSAGVRLGRSGGVTYKRFIHAEEAIELLLSGRNNGLQLTGTYQYHKPLDFNFSDRFYLHYGVGGHFGYEKRNDYRFIRQFNTPPPPTDPFGQTFEVGPRRQSQFTMGIDALVGVEYRWLSVPITLGIDLKPYFDFIGMRTSRFRFWDAAFTARYIF